MAVPKTIFEAIQLFNYRVALAMGGGVITTIANKMRGYTIHIKMTAAAATRRFLQ